MDKQAFYRLAVADAMQLHDERVRKAIERTRMLRAELEAAEQEQRAVMAAHDAFRKAYPTPEAGRDG